jgi:hypothetical protein
MFHLSAIHMNVCVPSAWMKGKMKEDWVFHVVGLPLGLYWVVSGHFAPGRFWLVVEPKTAALGLQPVR